MVSAGYLAMLLAAFVSVMAGCGWALRKLIRPPR